MNRSARLRCVCCIRSQEPPRGGQGRQAMRRERRRVASGGMHSVAHKNLVKRIATALDALRAADDPLDQPDAARRLREAADELEAAYVDGARNAGATWNDIAACYGLTKQGAQQRFHTRRKSRRR